MKTLICSGSSPANALRKVGIESLTAGKATAYFAITFCDSGLSIHLQSFHASSLYLQVAGI